MEAQMQHYHSQATDRHECREIRGKVQEILKIFEKVGNQGPQVWHLLAPTFDIPVIFIISYCPFCGQKLD